MFRSLVILLTWSILAFPAALALQLAPPKTSEISVEQGVNIVLTEFVIAAEKNAQLPTKDEEPNAQQHRLTGDRLTEFLMRAAAQKSAALPVKIAAESFLLAVGIGLDDSETLLELPLVGTRIQRLEAPALRKRRLATLGRPTMRDRRDLCQHFAVSLTLSMMLGAPAAEAAGAAKELKDMNGKSGFSFEDLQADLAGIAFQLNVCKGDSAKKLADLANNFTVATVLPDHQELPSGLSAEQFKQRFGDAQDDRFRHQIEAMRSAVNELYDPDQH